MANRQTERRSATRVRLPVWAAVLVFTLVAIVLVGSGIWVFNLVSDIAGSFDGNNTADPPALTPSVEVNADGTPVTQLAEVIVTIKDPDTGEIIEVTATPDATGILSQFTQWEGTERVNILMMGIDSRCEEEGPTRTDSLMLLSIDPVAKTASGLSIPRDTWVEIPQHGNDRINKANYWGIASEYPGGGPALAMETVEKFIGVKVHHYVGVNFEAFRDFINLIGGIQVEVPERIEDPTYPDECYGYDPFVINKGVQSLNGPLALQYARTRATDGGDIDRAERQQQVVLAVRQKLLDVQEIPNLIRRAPQLWKTFERNVDTSLSQQEIIQLALLVQDIQAQDIEMKVIDYNYVYNQMTPDGQQVLVPDYEKIADLREDLFSAVRAPRPVVTNLAQHVIDENARIAVWNGTQTFGLASETQEYLEDRGFNVVDIGNADTSQYPRTRVFDYGDNEYTRLYLTEVLGLPPLDVAQNDDTPDGDFDVLVILGIGWEIPLDSK